MSYLFSIPPLDNENLSGLLKISIARVVDIASYPDVYDGIAVQELTFNAGKEWTVWNATYQSASFEARSTDSQEGIFKNQRLPFIIPRHSVNEVMLTKAERDEFVIMVEDFNKFKYLFGSPSKPVRFQYDKNTGAQAQRNQYDCLFFSEASDNVIIYPHTFGTQPPISDAPPVVVRRGSISGPVLAVAPAGSTVVITSPYSFGYFLETS